jgi:hypothetical protein
LVATSKATMSLVSSPAKPASTMTAWLKYLR